MNRREALRGVGSLVLLLGASELAFGASIVAVRVWPADEYTRVTLESDTPLAIKHSLLGNPQRLVIDIDGLELSPELRELVGKVRPLQRPPSSPSCAWARTSRVWCAW